MKSPVLGIALAYWLHMLATVVWIGGLSAVTLLVLPAARRTLDDLSFAAFLEAIQHRLDRLGWFCLVLLVGTGMVQMSNNPNYNGLLAIDNLWAGAILAKHILILVMVGVSAALTWGALPALRRSLLRAGAMRADADPGRIQEAARASQASARLLRINLILSIIVLALTAVARAA